MCAKAASRMFTGSNPLITWLRQLDGLRQTVAE